LSPGGSLARVYALVGLNESGKTTLLEGVDLFKGANEDEVLPKQLGGFRDIDPNQLMPISERANFNGEIAIRVGVELDEADIGAVREYLKEAEDYTLSDFATQIDITETYTYEDSRFQRRNGLWSGIEGKGTATAESEEKSLRGEHQEDRRKTILTFLQSRLPSIWYFPHFLFDFPEKIYIEPYEGEPDTNRFYRELFQDILSALGKDLDLDRHLIARFRSADQADKTNLEQILLEVSRDVTQRVISAWDHIFAAKAITGKQVTVKVNEAGPDSEAPGRIYVEFGIADADGLFRIAERSVGFRWFFTYLMLTIYRGQRDATENMLYLFDEPASNLHPTAQRALLDSLGELSKQAVVVYTTHSHYLIEPAWLGQTSVVANSSLGEDTVSPNYTAKLTDITVTPYHQFAAQQANQSFYFQPILDVLEYTPSAIDPGPEAVMVEGRSDFFVLRYFEEVVQRRGAGERLGFMPGAGAGSLDSLIQLYIGWARPFVVLLDSDKTGKREQERYTKKFGRLVDERILSLAELGGCDCKAIESLFTEEDRLAFQRILDPAADKFNKSAWLLGIQEALVTKHHLDLSEETTVALTKICEALREKLAAAAKEGGQGAAGMKV
jgi:hypothetical protein